MLRCTRISDPHYIWLCKIAVATAIIRQCPKELSAQAYAVKLCERYQLDQTDWERRHINLHQEVTSLKQRLVLTETSGMVDNEQIMLDSSETGALDTQAQRGKSD